MVSVGYSSSLAHMRSLYKEGCISDPMDATDDFIRANVNLASSPTDLRQAINSLQFLCQAVPGFEAPIPSPPSQKGRSAEELLAGSLTLEEAAEGLGELLLVANVGEADGACPTPNAEASDKRRAGMLRRLWRISDSVSAIDCELARSPADVLKVKRFQSFLERWIMHTD